MTDDPSIESPDHAEWYYMKGENLDGSPVIASLIPNPEGWNWIVSIGASAGLDHSVSGHSDSLGEAKNAANHVFCAMFPTNDINPEQLQGMRYLAVLASSEPCGTA